MDMQQAALTRKLAEMRKKEQAEKARLEAIRRTQEAAVSNMVAAALKELVVLQRKPSGKHDEVGIVARRHAARILAVALDGEAL